MFTKQPSYAFLAHPPPQPSPQRRNGFPSSPTFYIKNKSIAAWAAHVQPGSPAPPSPSSPPSQRRPSLSRRSPTSPKLVDLTALGYTTVFVHFPKTPTTPSPYLRSRHTQQQQPATVDVDSDMAGPQQQQQQRSASSTLGRLRSLASLRARGRSKSINASSSKAIITNPGAGATSKKSTTPKAREESKRAKYTRVLPPPPLANELALMQFADGGSIDAHAKRVMQAQAKAAAGSHANARDAGLGVVHRDEKGGVWWDEDEEYEYAHLLDDEDVDMYDYEEEMGAAAWVSFGAAAPGVAAKENLMTQQRALDIAALAGVDSGSAEGELERRGSLSTQDSDLDARYLVKPADSEAPLPILPGLSVLSVPLRARRGADAQAKHLRKPEFLVDLAAFGPRSPSPSKSFADAAGCLRQKGKARRRPAPLKLFLAASSVKKPSNPALPTAGLPLVEAETARKEFIEDSFEPEVPQTQNNRKAATYGLGVGKPAASGAVSPLGTPTRGWRFRVQQVGGRTGSGADLGSRKPSRLDLRSVFANGVRNPE
ncbi:hypothetical protein AX17_002204 [Amanita inopinata Kibby_2008]|nr:hypothetical protein AX17_002204 [Amanita inopinata Kibby_2008]